VPKAEVKRCERDEERENGAREREKEGEQKRPGKMKAALCCSGHFLGRRKPPAFMAHKIKTL
jgi:hypothetical protein